MKKNNLKAWLYLLPAILFLGVFMVYPLIDVCFYSLEENYHSISQTYTASDWVISDMCSAIRSLSRH